MFRKLNGYQPLVRPWHERATKVPRPLLAAYVKIRIQQTIANPVGIGKVRLLVLGAIHPGRVSGRARVIGLL